MPKGVAFYWSLPYRPIPSLTVMFLIFLPFSWKKGYGLLMIYLLNLMKSLIPSLTVAATLVRPDQVVSIVLLSVKYGPNTKRVALSHVLVFKQGWDYVIVG